jgi:hypothetical protein
MTISFEEQTKNPRGRITREDVPSAKELLEQAHALASEVEGLLTKLSRGVADADTFRVRLARAHTLSLLDQLAELIGTRPSGHGPAVRNCGTLDRGDDENAASGVRRANAWRQG